MAGPQIPRSKTNPTGTTRIQRAVNAGIQVRFEAFAEAMTDYVGTIPVTTDERVSSFTVYNAETATRYIYALDDTLIDDIDNTIDRLVLHYLFDDEDSYTPQYFFSKSAELGYTGGTTDAVDNFTAQMEDYPRRIEFVLSSQPFRSRIRYIGSRAFEQLHSFTDEMKGSLRNILTQGMTRGRNPLDIARDVQKYVLGDPKQEKKGAANRAKLIARTEISNAHRRALWDEHLAAVGMGVNAELMHLSALIAGRTRRTHAARHGWTGTVEAEEEWYSKDGNAINCLCSTVSVITDANGKPINQRAVDKQLARREKFLDVAPEPI